MLIPTFLAADTPHTCGAASLYNLARILGIEVELEETDDALKQNNGKRLVNNFAELVASAKDIGIELQGVKLTYKHLQEFDTPIIAHLKTTFENDNPSESGSSNGHFIVVEHAAENWVRIFDTPKKILIPDSGSCFQR
jgi:ABC-type bacteriocin/lantibiotic exporter with double-glycine peptidase domain